MKLQHPFSLLLSGPSGSGKTVFTLKLIESCRTTIDPPIDRVTYVFQQDQDAFKSVAQRSPVPVSFVNSLDDVVPPRHERLLLVVDDFMNDPAVEEIVANYFIKNCHHQNVSVCYMVQNLFHKSRFQRTISLNASYIYLGKNPRAGLSNVVSLGMQMYPGRTNFLKECYLDATRRPFGYLFLDLKQITEEDLRVRTNVLDPVQQIVYVMKKKP